MYGLVYSPELHQVVSFHVHPKVLRNFDAFALSVVVTDCARDTGVSRLLIYANEGSIMLLRSL